MKTISLNASRRAAAFALLAAVLSIGSAVRAAAQTGPLAITNNTACAVTVCFDSPITCITVGPNSSTTVQVSCNGRFAIQICGALRRIGPSHTFLSNVNVGGCCADVALSPGFVACTWFLSIDPAAGPCPC